MMEKRGSIGGKAFEYNGIPELKSQIELGLQQDERTVFSNAISVITNCSLETIHGCVLFKNSQIPTFPVQHGMCSRSNQCYLLLPSL
jgi:hypothetical protein